jgi:hypothetical protein
MEFLHGTLVARPVEISPISPKHRQPAPNPLNLLPNLHHGGVEISPAPDVLRLCNWLRRVVAEMPCIKPSRIVEHDAVPHHGAPWECVPPADATFHDVKPTE